jgi:ketopantoate reductase
MEKIIILIGTGEMGSVFARGFLKTGYTVIPVLRDTDIKQLAQDMPEPELVLVSVGENDLETVLTNLPQVWLSKIGLLQNELLPRDWQTHNIQNPTVISVWFEKKPGQDFKVLISSPCFGPKAPLLQKAINSLTIPCHIVKDENELLFELVVKNVYILTTNIAGLRVGGTVDELWNQHQDFAREVANEIMDIQEYLTGVKFDREKVISAMVNAINGDLEHQCMGRSAAVRLRRALEIAKKEKLKVSLVHKIKV